jgi:hypothetical protein
MEFLQTKSKAIISSATSNYLLERYPYEKEEL